MATAILCYFSLPVGSRHRLRRRSCDSRRQPHYPNTIVVGTWMTFYTISSSSKAQAGGLCTARRQLSPWPSTATVATWRCRFGVNAHCRLGFDCPRYIADTCIGFRQSFHVWFFIPHRVHSLLYFGLSTTFRSTPWWPSDHTVCLTSPFGATDPSFFTRPSPAFFFL